MTLSPQREKIKAWLLQQEGRPYLWTAKGMKEPLAYDCSGLVTAALVKTDSMPAFCPRCGLAFREYHNADRLFHEFMPILKPEPLDLAFWGRGSAHHVGFVWDDGRIFGAHGGDRNTKSIEVAEKIGARVTWRPDVNFMLHFLGYRRLPAP